MGKSLDDDFGDLVGIAHEDEVGETGLKPNPFAEKTREDFRREERKEVVRELAAGRPSPYQSGLRARLKDRRQFSLGDVPVFVHEEFERLLKDHSMTTKRELFYHLLREAGADIPPYEKMDRRAGW